MSTRDNLWLFIYFPRLALESHFRMLPDDNRPQLLLHSATRDVLQCNDAALQAGVRPGMSRNTAYCLLEDVLIAQFDPVQEKEALERLAWLGYRFSSHVSLSPPDGLLLEIASMLKLFQGIQNYGQALTQQLQNAGYQFVCATGLTARQAETFARSQQHFFIADRQQLQQQLQLLSTESLLLPDKVRQRLHAMGLRTYRQLQDLPQRELGYRFGQHVITYLASLQKDLEPANPFVLPNRFQESLELFHEATQAKQLLFPIKRMLVNLEQYLLARQLTAERLWVLLKYRSQTSDRLLIQATGGAQKQQQWLSLLSVRLEQVQLREPVIALQLKAQHFLEQDSATTDLLSSILPNQDDGHLLDLLSSRIGHQRVLRLSATPDPRPQQASKLTAAIHPTNKTQLSKNDRYYPLFCLADPKRINPKHYQLISSCERIVTGRWLSTQGYRKDFYRAIHIHNGQMHWLSRCDDGQWRLEGIFS